MSKFKVGDRVRVIADKNLPANDGYGAVVKGQGDGNGWHSVRLDSDWRVWSVHENRLVLLTELAEQQKTIDLDAIQVGDEVLIRVQVVRTDSTDANLPLMVNANGLSRIWVLVDSIAAHITKPPVPPATLAELKAMPEAMQARVYAELVKKGGG